MATVICEMDSSELACRIFEGMYPATRTPGLSAEDLIRKLESHHPECHAGLMKATWSAIEYLNECMKNGKVAS